MSLSNHSSAFAPVQSGVHQGSVLCHILFSTYIEILSAIIDHLQFHLSAPDNISELLHSMQSCIGDVKAWVNANMLQHNDNKTELMFVT